MEVKFTINRQGAFLNIPRLFFGENAPPKEITLICNGKEIKARLYFVYPRVYRYRVYSKYASHLADDVECKLVN